MVKLWFRLALILSGISVILLIAVRFTHIPRGDAAHGAVLYAGASSPYLPCIQCHEYPSLAPPMDHLVERVRQVRLADPAIAGETLDQYLAESILSPDRYIAPGYAAGGMPSYRSRLSETQLQDLVAFLMTL